MGTGHTRLQRRGGVYWFRAKVPRELVSIIGRREFHRSLGTSDPDEARKLVHIESGRIDAKLLEARRKLAQAPIRVLSTAEIDHIALAWFHEREVQAVEDDTEADEADEYATEEYRDDLGQQLSILQSGNNTTCLMIVQDELKEICRQNGIEIDFKDRAFLRLHELVRRGMAEQVRRQLRRLRASHSIENGDSFFSEVDGSKPFQRPAPITLDRLIERFEAARPPATSSKTTLKRAAQMRLIREVIGSSTSIDQIGRETVRRVYDTVTVLPSNATKRFPNLSVAAACEKAKADGISAMSAVTANSYLSALHALLDFAVHEELIGRNPAQGLRVADSGPRAKDRRYPFSTDQLKAIFDAPIYRSCIGEETPRTARFWVPLIALFTGMRLNEICQLDVADIVEREGTALILVRAEEGRKHLKTQAAERIIPVHSELKRLGLMKFHANVCKGEGRLFPELTAGSTGYVSDNFSKWFRRFLIDAKAAAPRTSFHSFRHNFRDALREADISPERVRALGGWSSGRTEDQYGSGIHPTTLARELEKIRFAGLDLSPLYVD